MLSFAMPIDLDAILTQKPHTPHWLVQDFVTRGSLVIVAGEPGVGKSVLSYHLAFCVATGLPFLGMETEQTRVLYFDEENSLPDFTEYARWVWCGLGCPSRATLKENLFIEHFALTNDWRAKMFKSAQEYKPGLIVVDTATPALRIKDENDNAEAARAINGLREAQRLAGNDTTMYVLKHAKIDDDEQYRRTVRGAKTWMGQSDAVLFHHADRGRPRNDGLRQSVLEPDKVRAFGLRNRVKIIPSWTPAPGISDPTAKGLSFKGEVVIPHDKK